MTVEVRRYSPVDEAAVARLLRLAYGGDETDALEYIRRPDPAWLRVAGAPAPTAMGFVLPLGQWYGGCVVRMAGIQAVAVAPEARGGGTALGFMQGVMRELHQEGVAISVLYASVQSLYRQVGYEQAGATYTTRLPLRRLARRRGPSPFVLLGPEDDPLVRACHAEAAARCNGNVDRSEYLWRRVRENRRVRTDGFGLRSADGARLEAYVFLAVLRPAPDADLELVVSDLAFLNGAAGQALLDFLASFSPTVEHARLPLGPTHALWLLQTQQALDCRWKENWLLRITHLPTAIESRGYPAGLQASLALALDDELLPEQAGEWIVEVADGRGRLRRPTRADDLGDAIRTGPRGLAAVWSGFLTASAAQAAGLLEGPPEALALAQAIFAGPAPWMIDRF